jgi:small subunit ribosomal protein S1
MVTRKQDSIPAIPSYDDGWWSAVLAEEEHINNLQRSRPAQHQSSPPKSMESTPEPVKTDNEGWERAKKVYQQDQIVELSVTGYNRGGLLVESEDLQGFVPFSHLVEMSNHSEGDERDAFFSSYVGRTLQLKIIECVPEEGRVVFSERAARSESGCRTKLFSSLQPDQRAKGEVTNITDFGVFIDLGGVEGLIHISELSWGRVIHPSDILKLGQVVEVQVLEVAPERCRVALSLKRLQPNPWESVRNRYVSNDIVSAVVTSIVSYGAFARLDEGLEGLIHASEIPLPPGTTVKDYLTPGQEVKVRILQVDANHQRLGLSLKLEEN